MSYKKIYIYRESKFSIPNDLHSGRIKNINTGVIQKNSPSYPFYVAEKPQGQCVLPLRFNNSLVSAQETRVHYFFLYKKSALTKEGDKRQEVALIIRSARVSLRHWTNRRQTIRGSPSRTRRPSLVFPGDSRARRPGASSWADGRRWPRIR